ncbi:CBP80/20-dependent translation initiation factor-like isoform X2 [Dreissena polymorpha]|uniref:CBP80/20-dependent translation initiation factor-like isoform X2 n=1 Tax=Dreissena polymorpha TaxID=45954 RepID=UPI0022647B06|nr:CBP80/20-dependent translation initiation factor-like isoform X2 [Dreissena polymorpha]
MATVVRGRGRGRGLSSRDLADGAVPRPGDGDSSRNSVSSNGSSTNSQSLTEIEDLISNLNLDITDMELETLLELAQNSPSDDASIKKMAEIVYTKCVKDREFSKTGAFICDKLAAVENNGTKFRSSLLSLVQMDYKEKDRLRAESVSKFLNSFSLMCQIFGTMRTAGGEVFKPLVGPVFECFQLILDDKRCNTDEYECVCEQLQCIGRDLEQNDREKMDQLMEKIRTKIIRDGASPQARCSLLELMECYCRGWKALSNDVTRFYYDTSMDILTD